MGKKPYPVVSLTDDQRRLVERNVRLAYLMAHRLRPVLKSAGIEFEDAASIGFVGMCKAAPRYSDALAKESTFFCEAARNEMLHSVRRASMKKRSGAVCISFDWPSSSDCEDADADTLWGALHDAHSPDPLDALIAKDLYRAYLDILPEQTQKVLNFTLMGYKGREIGSMMGVSQTMIYRRLLNARESIRAYGEAAQ